MKGKILLVTGLAVGYVLGARAGRERYNDIVRTANKFWHSPQVQKQVNSAEDYVKDRAPEVAEYLADGAKKVVSQVTGTTKKAPAKPRKAATPRTTAAKD